MSSVVGKENCLMCEVLNVDYGIMQQFNQLHLILSVLLSINSTLIQWIFKDKLCAKQNLPWEFCIIYKTKVDLGKEFKCMFVELQLFKIHLCEITVNVEVLHTWLACTARIANLIVAISEATLLLFNNLLDPTGRSKVVLREEELSDSKGRLGVLRVSCDFKGGVFRSDWESKSLFCSSSSSSSSSSC
jgi:hypothetical protein